MPQTIPQVLLCLTLSGTVPDGQPSLTFMQQQED